MGIKSINNNQLLVTLNGSKLSSLTIKANQKAAAIKSESIHKVITRFLARGALIIERIKLSITRSFAVQLKGITHDEV
jgi:hypothetical protein